MRDAVALARFRQLWCGRQRRAIERASLGLSEIGPQVAVAFLTGETAGIDALALQLGISGERGNRSALPGARVELPAVVGALHGPPIEMTQGERVSAMRADVAQRKYFSLGVAPRHQRHLEARGSDEPAPAQFFAAQDGIPKSPQKFPIAAGAGENGGRLAHCCRGLQG